MVSVAGERGPQSPPAAGCGGGWEGFSESVTGVDVLNWDMLVSLDDCGVKRRDQALCFKKKEKKKKKRESSEVMDVFCRSNISALNKRVKDTTVRAQTHSQPLIHAGMSTHTLKYKVFCFQR